MSDRTDSAGMSGEDMVALSKRYTLFDWQAQQNANPIPVERAEGVYFWSPDGKRYLDFNSQLMGVNIGHGDRERLIAEPVGQHGRVSLDLQPRDRHLARGMAHLGASGDRRALAPLDEEREQRRFGGALDPGRPPGQSASVRGFPRTRFGRQAQPPGDGVHVVRANRPPQRPAVSG